MAAADPVRDKMVLDVYGSSMEFTWSRHDTSARIEGYVIEQVLAAWLPEQPAEVADVGGGNGRWAFALADRGYRVALSDVSEALVADARQRQRDHHPLMRCEVADARHLPYADASFHACVLFGPLYSVRDVEDRAQVLAEARRVVRPGGVIVAQYLTRLAGLRNVLSYAAVRTGRFDWRRYLETGVFEDPTVPTFYRANTWLTEEEIVAEVAGAGLELRLVQGMDAPAPGHGQEALEAAADDLVRQWGEIALELGGTAAGRASSDHLIVVARRP